MVGAVSAYGASHGIEGYLPTLWLLLVCSSLLWRVSVAFRFSRGRLSIEQARNWFPRFALANGLLMGGGFAAFMPSMDLVWQAMLTMFCTSLVAVSIPSTALNAKSFTRFTFPGVGLLALSWMIAGKMEPKAVNWIVAALLLGFGWFCTLFVVAAEKSAREAYDARADQARLVEILRQQERALIAQRDIAENTNILRARQLAALIHDLRQPLQSVAMFQSALIQRELDERARWFVDQSGQSIQTLSNLLGKLTDLSQVEVVGLSSRPTIVSLRSTIERIVAQLGIGQIGSTVDWRIEVDPKFGLLVDAIALERVVRNLLGNALAHAKPSVILIRCALGTDKALSLTIVDDGPGIPVYQRELVFKEFVRFETSQNNRGEGTGLGLAIVQRLCAQMGASCEITQSQEYSGACFEVRFASSSTRLIEVNPPVSKPLEGEADLKIRRPPILHVSLDEPDLFTLNTLRSFRSDLQSADSLEALELLAQDLSQTNARCIVDVGSSVAASQRALFWFESQKESLNLKQLFIILEPSHPLIDGISMAPGVQILVKPLTVQILQELVSDFQSPDT